MNNEASFHSVLGAGASECWLVTRQCAQTSEAKFQHLMGRYEQRLALSKQHGDTATTQSNWVGSHNLNKQYDRPCH
jgi:hypothetical protein